jgi:hypothetical protein
MDLIMAKMLGNDSDFPSDFSSDDLSFAFASASFGLIGVARASPICARDNQRDLPDIGGISRHVRAGDDKASFFRPRSTGSMRS